MNLRLPAPKSTRSRYYNTALRRIAPLCRMCGAFPHRKRFENTTLQTLGKLCRALGCRPAELFEGGLRLRRRRRCPQAYPANPEAVQMIAERKRLETS